MKHVKHLLDLVQEVGERVRLVVFVVQSVAIPLGLSDAAAGISFASVMIPESNHVFPIALATSDRFDPLFCCLRLKEALEQVVNLPCVSLKVRSNQDFFP